MFGKKKEENETYTLSPELQKLKKFIDQQIRYKNYKKALDNITNYTLIVDYNEALELMSFLGTDDYDFIAMGFHDITSSYDYRHIPAEIKITKKQSKEGE